MRKIYYAHHQWKYNTDEEQKEIQQINENLEGFIVNPNGWVYENGNEEYCMGQCFHFIKMCDVLVFSTIENGIMGKGVYSEIKHALDNEKTVFYLNNKGLLRYFYEEDYKKIEIIVKETGTNRKYAKL